MRGRGRPSGGWIDDAERKPALVRIRDRHRNIAELFAAGLTRNEVADRVGMSPQRVGQLYNDPAFQELIAQYRLSPEVIRSRPIDQLAHQRAQMARLNERLLAQYNDLVDYHDDTGEPMAACDIINGVRVFSDRIGLGPSSTTTHVYDFAQELENRRLARMKTITIGAKGLSTPSPLLLEGSGQPPTHGPLPSTSSRGDGEDEIVAAPSRPLLRRRL